MSSWDAARLSTLDKGLWLLSRRSGPIPHYLLLDQLQKSDFVQYVMACRDADIHLSRTAVGVYAKPDRLSPKTPPPAGRMIGVKNKLG